MKKKLSIKLLFLTLPAFVAGIVLFAPAPHVDAAYNGANLIDNSKFLNTNSMSLQAIQNHLVSKGSGLASRSFILDCGASNGQVRQWYSAIGAPCDRSLPAADHIYYAAKVYGLNPQVIIATLQKEQSLITSPNPTDWQINQAMGYGCPTTGGCSASNFFYQIDNGTWALRYHYERANGNFNWWRPSTSWVCGTTKDFYKPNLYPRQHVSFYDEDGVMYRSYFIENAATSAFYCYTPHAYNNFPGCKPAHGVSYASWKPTIGHVGMCYSGSYNFVTFFEQWFGPTNKPPIPDCPTGTALCVWAFINEDTGRTFYTASLTERNAVYLQNFTYLGVAAFARKNSTDATPVYRLYNISNNYHLYTTNNGEKNSLLAGGGWNDEGIGFYADPLWSNTGYTVRRLYTQNGGGRHLFTADTNQIKRLLSSGYVDEGPVFKSASPMVTPPIPPVNKENVYRFFLNSKHFFTNSLDERDILINMGARYEGVAWQSPSALSSNKQPVYRLYSLHTGRHFWTMSQQERSIILSWGGWRDEGIGMYGQPDGQTPVHRFYNTVTGAHIFTISEAERSIINGYRDWRYEGVAWRL